MPQKTLTVAASNDDMYYYIAGGASYCDNDTIVVIGGHMGDQCNAWFRFINFPVTGRQGIITSAKLYLHATLARSPTATVKIYMEDADNPDQSPCDMRSETWTTAFVNWALPNVGVGDHFYSEDFSTVLQEVIDRPGFTAGNAVLVIVEGVAGGGDVNGHWVAGYEHPTSDPAQLIVSWKPRFAGAVI